MVHLRKYWPLYLMVLPGVAFFIIFRFIPIGGSFIAFQDYSVFHGIKNSPWVGFKHFEILFDSPSFYRILTNTIILGLLKVVILFPVPIVLALMINEVRLSLLKKGFQTALYIPHFLSWVIIAGITFDMFSLSGIFNTLRDLFGYEPNLIMQQEQYFRWIYVLTGIWRDAGWGTIIYLAAISSMDPQIYESAIVDGASRLKQMLKITIPLLLPTATILFLLDLGNFMELGFDHVYNLLTPMTYSVGDIIDTYVYRTGIQEMRYSFATAVGLFQAVIGFILVMIFNRLSKKVSDGGLW
ncbi:ABC transporter permease [Paenibacillus nasutitermitis]|uniref:Multiple-sugar transport system permease YteP n=1 Tax=Paenibacillus nasutitermitis TaxID=1652958 RepID=A0A916YTK7_9BACL|nr:ABC transporter permease subunit [Paenibacillus nasutitermitis]GGD60673.1 putative multiple-sugar transport system permease YteP [Paenibacillus nasutitermitis]